MTDQFDPDWPHGHVTRDGRKARIFKERLNNATTPLVVAVQFLNGTEIVGAFNLNGTHEEDFSPSLRDLLNAPAPVTVWEGWAVMLSSGRVEVFASENSANFFLDTERARITPVRIEFPGETK